MINLKAVDPLDAENKISIKESKDSYNNDKFDVKINGELYVFRRIDREFDEQDGFDCKYFYVLEDPFGGHWWGPAREYGGGNCAVYNLVPVKRVETVVTKVVTSWERRDV